MKTWKIPVYVFTLIPVHLGLGLFWFLNPLGADYLMDNYYNWLDS